MGANGASGGYNLENSLRFRSSAGAYLNRTPATAGNRKTFTISLWMKGSLESSPALFQARESSSTGQPHFVLMGSNGSLYILDQSPTIQIITTAVFRDPSAWYHVVVAIDTTEAIAADRAKIYVNGDKIESFNTLNTFPLNYDTAVNNTVRHLVGARMPNSSTALVTYLDGYLTEVNFVDGQALTPSDFGEYNEDTGVWQPIKYTSTYGTNGFYLKGRGTDNSGNGNNWTENNFNTTNSALTTYDIMTDVPTLTNEDTANYCTLNPLNALIVAPYGVLDANLTYTSHNAVWRASGATIYPTTGKWYYEGFFGTLGSGSYLGIGLKIPGLVGAEYVGQTANSWGILGNNTFLATYTGNVATNNVSVTITTSTAVQVAVDFDAGKMWFGYNNNWLASGNPSTGANPTYTFTPNTQLQPILCAHNCTTYINFGQRPFAYTPPTGYLKLNTFNLPDSSIVDGSENFNTVLYTGNGTSQSITGVNFQPDWLWLKSRSNVASHGLFDVSRVISGVPAILSTNTFSAENTADTYISSFDSDGFSVNSNTSGNGSGQTYVSWNWKAGGAAVSNTDGTITSQVSANPTAGFSVVTYSGAGANATVGHGLGVAPSMVILKNRTGIGLGVTYHSGMISASYWMGLGLSQAQGITTFWNDTAPSSSVFSLGGNNVNTNSSSHNYVAYCFAEVEGYSKMGNYTGNGSTDGPFIYTGFRPAWILIKRADAAGHWYVLDSARSGFNLTNAMLAPNLSAAEFSTTENNEDFLSNGFKLRTSNVESNANGATYIYTAFAENPFKNSLAR